MRNCWNIPDPQPREGVVRIPFYDTEEEQRLLGIEVRAQKAKDVTPRDEGEGGTA
jgi:hypothetical protein